MNMWLSGADFRNLLKFLQVVNTSTSTWPSSDCWSRTSPFHTSKILLTTYCVCACGVVLHACNGGLGLICRLYCMCHVHHHLPVCGTLCMRWCHCHWSIGCQGTVTSSLEALVLDVKLMEEVSVTHRLHGHPVVECCRILFQCIYSSQE